MPLTTYDRRTIDSSGAFLIGELERLDPTIHDPLVSVTWSRDIDLREDVTIADETSSFTNSTFAAVGGINPAGKGWIGKTANAISSVALDIGKTAQPLYLWGMELSYTIPELESAQRLGRPVDSMKFEAIRVKHQMDIDEMVYIGDTFLGVTGMVNSVAVTASNVAADAQGHTTWAQNLRLRGLETRLPFVTGCYTTRLLSHNLITNVGHAAGNARLSGQGSYATFVNIAIGTGTTAAAASDTALGTEITTGGGARGAATASQTTTNVTNDTTLLVKTFTFTAAFAVTEEGILDNATSGGNLLAHQVFAAINVVSGDSLSINHKYSS